MNDHRLADAVQRLDLPVLMSASALAFSFLAFLATNQPADAKAPPLATTVVNTTSYAVPDMMAPSVGTIPAGSQIELTGEAAPGFLAVYYGDGVVWVPAQNLALGVRPGIDTAVALIDTPLLEAPLRDAAVVVIVPEAATVILTGARVDGYDAASHDGSGGWINERDIAR